MWCVVADNGDEFWVYGMFSVKRDAMDFAERRQEENPKIEYSVAEHISKYEIEPL